MFYFSEEAQRIDAVLQFDVLREGTLTGVALWFDTDIGLDCSPAQRPTHWKQTVISTPE